MTPFDDWIASACTALDIDQLTVADRTLLLDLTKEIAHGVARPAAPVTAYLVGVAVGRGVAVDSAAATVSALVADWTRRQPEDSPAGTER